MNLFQKYIQEIREQIDLKNNQQAIKRLIDFTLDTEKLSFYKSTNRFLNWYDANESSPEVSEKLTVLLDELAAELSQKELKEHQILVKMLNLEKKYSSEFTLGPINLEIKSGEIVGLVGENGNGKTTLLRSICGELQPTKGELYFLFPHSDGYDLRSKLIYIPQRTQTWRGSMYENLEFTASSYGYSPEENNEIIDLVITRMGLRKYKNYSWSRLSSGYKMRFELARMLLRKPKILLIDEPLANLDIIAQQSILEDFRNIANSPFRPIAVILSSQQLYEVEKTSDLVVFLKNGVQKNLNISDTDHLLTIEFETDENAIVLQEKLKQIRLLSLEKNGNTFVAEFGEGVSVNNFLGFILQENINIMYFRNITHSTRKFFIK